VKNEPVEKGLTVLDKADQIIIDTGVIQCVLKKNDNTLIKSILRQQKEVARDGKLILSL